MPGEAWHLGHPDSESVGGPEHRRCNVGAPMRLRSRRAWMELEHVHTGWVWTWGSEPPAFSIGYEKPSTSGDSGFTVLFTDAPDPDDVGENGEHPAVRVVCGRCLLDDHPEVEPGLQVAREYGVADLADGGEWMVGDLSRLSG